MDDDDRERKEAAQQAEAIVFAVAAKGREEELPSVGELDLAERLRRIRQRPPHLLSWADLRMLWEQDPEAGRRAWEAMKEMARVELSSGHRAAEQVEWLEGPLQRAQFLALRESFWEQWKPAGGVEDALVDTMVQAYTCYLIWLERLQVLTRAEADTQLVRGRRGQGWEPATLGAAQERAVAGEMVDRFNRLFLRTLRALRDLRRYTPSVVIANAGQVNIGERQVNLVERESGDGEPDKRALPGT